MQQLKIKLAEGATMPTKANVSDSGYDIVATSVRYDEQYGFFEYGTGIYLEIPEGYEVNLLPRSSISKVDLIMCNSPGKVDELYRNELLFRFKPIVANRKELGGLMKVKLDIMGNSTQRSLNIYKVGDKIGQMEMRKKHEYELVQVSAVEATHRGGFGSTDKHSPYTVKDILL